MPAWQGWAMGMLLLTTCTGFWLLQPRFLFVFNDDFGYLRSVVRTIQLGRPWTDDWLEPWSATLSLAGWALYSLTHHFILSLRLLQLGSLLASGWALQRLFRRLLPPWRALGAATLLLMIPTVLCKFTELGGMMLYIPCLLWGLHFALGGRWGAFTLCVILATGCRQGAIAWLALPGIQALLHARQRDFARVRDCLIPVTAGLGSYVLLSRFMNHSHAQVVMTGDMWRNLSLQRFTGNLMGCLPLLPLGPGLALLLAGTLSGDRSPGWPRTRKGVAGCFLALLALAACAYAVSAKGLIGFEHPLYQEQSLLWLCCLGLTTALGLWSIQRHIPSLPLLAGAGATLALVCLRGAVYDYYCIDFVAFTMAAWLGARKTTLAPESAPLRKALLAIRLALIGGMLLLAGLSLARLQRHLNEMATRVYIAETSLRKGAISPDELSVAPFGLQGWHLYPHFIKHEGAQGDYIANFQKYLRPGALELQELGAARPGDPQVIDVRLGPLYPTRHYRLERRLPRPAAPWPLDLRTTEPFPLSETEWDALLRSPPPRD